MKLQIGFLPILFFIFLTLKLTNQITWSWWWVTSPLWGIFPIILTAVILTLIVIGIIYLWDYVSIKRRLSKLKNK